MSTARPIAVSMGDPTGIGPEVTLAALQRRALRSSVRPILVGDPAVYEVAAAQLGIRRRMVVWSPSLPLPDGGALAVYPVATVAARDRRPGHPSIAGGRAAYAAILAGMRLVRDGYADALVTAPICKANLVAAGINAPGHTELLAKLCGGVPVRMMMTGTRLRVVLATTHLAIRDVPSALTSRLVRDTLVIADAGLRRHFGIVRPRLGVAGLNPHAGEGGLFGDEERRIIAPAVRAARRAGIDARGPLAADSLFPLAAAGGVDAVICMYHDQGLAPFKLLHFADGVNVTIGLPFVRTSPDHGTAHDIAGRGVADPSSMAAALALAATLGTARSRQPSARSRRRVASRGA